MISLDLLRNAKKYLDNSELQLYNFVMIEVIYHYIVVVVYLETRLELPIAMHTGIIIRNTQCIYR